MWQIFITQTFSDGDGNEIPGELVLGDLFHLHHISSWGMFGTLLGYILFFRLNQWYLLAQQTDRLPFKLPSMPAISFDFFSSSGAEDADVIPDEVEAKHPTVDAASGTEDPK